MVRERKRKKHNHKFRTEDMVPEVDVKYNLMHIKVNNSGFSCGTYIHTSLVAVVEKDVRGLRAVDSRRAHHLHSTHLPQQLSNNAACR